jgi:predicted TIM-barrel fold metal-dependent hydrolase
VLLDTNAYVGHWPFKQLKHNSCALLLDRMNKFGVDVSVISNIHGIFYKNTQSANDELYEEIKSDPRFHERFIPFAVINPIYAGWKDDFETCFGKMKMKGLRLYPKYHDYEITDPALIQLVQMARDRGLPVSFDIRMVDSRQRSWMDIPLFEGNATEKFDIITKEWDLRNVVPIIREVPDAKYIIVNLANGVGLDDDELAIVKKADILFDTSGRALRQDDSLSALLKRFGPDKFAFGTHSPILDYVTGRLRIESMSDSEADEKTKEMIRSGNAKRTLGIGQR